MHARWLRAARTANYVGRRKLRPGVRTLAGLALIVGGAFGFLPILGYWMIPLGIGLIALEFPPARRAIDRWLKRRKKAAGGAKTPDDSPDGSPHESL